MTPEGPGEPGRRGRLYPPFPLRYGYPQWLPPEEAGVARGKGEGSVYMALVNARPEAGRGTAPEVYANELIESFYSCRNGFIVCEHASKPSFVYKKHSRSKRFVFYSCLRLFFCTYKQDGFSRFCNLSPSGFGRRAAPVSLHRAGVPERHWA